MPVWNGERYLSEAIDSILTQSFADFEFIILDDGSTDATPEILASYHDPRIRIFRLEHGGIVLALNFGIAQARAAWIARQDADDISRRDRLEKQWRAVCRNRQAVLVHTDVDLIGEGIPPKRARFPKTKALLVLRLCYLCPIVHGSVMFQREAFAKAGGYRPEERHAEDFSLWGRMIELGDFVGLPERLFVLRLHSESVSKQHASTQVSLTERISAEHCQRFMRLPSAEAHKSQAILRTLPEDRRWRDWWWFLTKCAPRLRWKSVEACSWVLWQTLRVLFRR